MTKKILFIVLLLLCFVGCSRNYDIENMVTIDNVGTFQIPQDWSYRREEAVLYIIKKDKQKEAVCLRGIMYNTNSSFDVSKLLKNAEFVRNVTSETFSNSAMIGRNEYKINDKIVEKNFLDLYSSRGCMIFIAESECASYDVLKEIAKSYKMCK